jgi:uncharacterized damage-inducible protein DinB
MILQTKWFERKFNFDYPVGFFPCILERIRGTPARLEEMLRSYSPGILTVQVNNGWSMQEHAGHLIDLDELHEARLEDFRLQRPILRPADLNNKKTFDAHYNATPVETILTRFRVVRGRFINRIEPLDETALSQPSVHPRLQQKMRLIDMIYFVAEHDDHHLALITSLATQLRK